jgi:hypothetical protein
MVLTHHIDHSEIAVAEVSGGANTSHTILFPALRALLNGVPYAAPASAYEQMALDANLLGKSTEGARRRNYRYLRELYVLDPDSLLFRALRDLWTDDTEAQPLLAGLCALARDSVFQASAERIFSTSPGDEVSSADLASAVGERFPDSYSTETLAKIGRNTFSSWEQTGHLASSGLKVKLRTRAICKPANVAYALMLAHLQGVRGQALFDTLWARALDHPKSHLFDLAHAASQRGLMGFRHAGGVVEVTFDELLRPFEGRLR